jgi:hypothetical protein
MIFLDKTDHTLIINTHASHKYEISHLQSEAPMRNNDQNHIIILSYDIIIILAAATQG